MLLLLPLLSLVLSLLDLQLDLHSHNTIIGGMPVNVVVVDVAVVIVALVVVTVVKDYNINHFKVFII